MNSLYRRFTLSLKLLLILTLLLSPFVAVNLTARAAPLAQDPQPGNQDDSVVVLDRLQNPDGTTTVTVRLYSAPNDPNAPETNFWMSQDTYIASGKPENNFGSATNMGVGYSNTGNQAMRMLLQFNLSGIPTGATVNSAKVYIYQYASSPSNDSPMGFQAQYAVSPWSEYNATWNNSNYIGGSTLPIGNFPSTLGWLSTDATNLFRSWVSGAEPNYGLILTGDESPSNNRSRYFYSSNAGGNRPYVDISYTTGCAYIDPPTSWVNGLPGTSPNAFTISWSGQAYTPSGCAANGISSYIVWYQVNGGSFVKWLDGVSYTSATFNASSLGIGNGAVVAFRSQAVDYYGNKTPAGNATAQTTIQSVNAAVSMTPLPTWTNSPNFTVSWTGFTNGGPAVTSYNFEVNINSGGWQRLLSNTPQTSFQYNGAQNGSNYQFRAQASNNSGASFGAWSAPSSTTVDTAAPSVTMDSLPQYTAAYSFWVSWIGSDATSGVASYNLQYQFNQGAWQTLISNTPQTSFYFQNAQTGNYGFRVQAVDKAGNASAWPSGAQASTIVVVNPVVLVEPLNPPILQASTNPSTTFTVNLAGYPPPNTYLTTYTITYRYDTGSGFGNWTTWITDTWLTTTQNSATFDWFAQGLPANAVYQFQATATNNLDQAPYDLPAQYWKSIIVDMAGKYQVRAYLPLVPNNAQ
jgi:hypothetical protein